MNRNICTKAILKAVGIAILAVLFYTVCEDNGVTVVTPDVSTFADSRDGKVYKKVQIGEQIWMAENLNYVAENSKCFVGYSGGVGGFEGEEACDRFGRLYDWNTAMDGVGSSHANPSGVEGVCPVGWHIPSDAEWTELIDYVGENAGTKLKSREFHDTHQPSGTPTADGTDKYRFSALKGPYSSMWWSSTERAGDDREAWIRHIAETQAGVWRQSFDKHEYFLSVRCVHD